MAKYVYPAIFTQEEEGGFSIRFPDIPGCYTSAETIDEGISMANDALCLMLYDMEENGETPPVPSKITSVAVGSGEFATLIACDTIEYRKFYDNRAVKKTLSIPSWLNTMAARENINFSAVLPQALKAELKL